MPRWELMADHYLRTTDSEWEYVEQSRDTGKQIRKRYQVPQYMPTGTIVFQGNGERNDVEFFGEPTPDMTPLDDEAEKISDALRHKWIAPVESLPAQGVMWSPETQAMMGEFAKQIGVTLKENVSSGQVSAEEFKALQEQVAELMARNAELEAAKSTRRV